MVSEQRWLAEGDGPDLVVMCAPPPLSVAGPGPGDPGEPSDPGYPNYP
jgi:hypothetical protein